MMFSSTLGKCNGYIPEGGVEYFDGNLTNFTQNHTQVVNEKIISNSCGFDRYFRPPTKVIKSLVGAMDENNYTKTSINHTYWNLHCFI